MLKKHFEIKQLPFSEEIPIDAILRDGRLLSVQKTLLALCEVGSIASLIARTGLGKTTIVRTLISEIKSMRDLRCIYLHLPSMEGSCLLRTMVYALDEKPKLGKDRLLQQIYRRAGKKGRSILLIVDEAHQLDSQALTDLRILTGSLEKPGSIKILLVGQTLLSKTLTADSLTDLKERILLRCSLKPLDEPETIRYIGHRLDWAEAEQSVFPNDIRKLIHHQTEGIPRCINNIATALMLTGIKLDKKIIDEEVFQTAKNEGMI